MSENNPMMNDPLGGLLSALLGGHPGGTRSLAKDRTVAGSGQGVSAMSDDPLMGSERDPQLAQMLGTKGTVSQKYLRDSGLVNQLAQQTGLDSKTATKSLQQVLQAFGTQMCEGTPEDRQKNLELA